MDLEERSDGLKINKTHRGFNHTSFTDRYGIKCSLQKSSAAFEDCIWLGVDDPEPKIMASKAEKLGVKTDERTGWIPYPISDEVNLSTRMHLTRKQVKDLLPHLIKFVATGSIELEE